MDWWDILDEAGSQLHELRPAWAQPAQLEGHSRYVLHSVCAEDVELSTCGMMSNGQSQEVGTHVP